MPEDIPENGVFPDNFWERAKANKFLDKFYTEEWLFALLSLGTTFGWSVSGFPPSIELGCVCWLITLAIALHYFWVWSVKRKLNWLFRNGIIISIPAFTLIFSWTPISTQYRIEHAPQKHPEFQLYINGKNVLDHSLIELPASRSIFIQIQNVGNETATGLTINFTIPIDPTNLDMPYQWTHTGEYPIITSNEISSVQGYNLWQTTDPGRDFIGTLFNATAFNILTNSPSPVFTKNQIETYEFKFSGVATNLSPDTLFPFMPATIQINSVESKEPKIVTVFLQY